MFPYTFSFPFPNGPVASSVAIARGPRALQFARGLKFGNVPAGRPDMVFHAGSGRVAHVNTVETVQCKPAMISLDGMYSGVIKFRFHDLRSFPVPVKIRG